MLLRDVNGTEFDSHEIEATTEHFDDPEKGALARVRLSDGTSRLLTVSELELAARDDIAGSSYFGSWPMPPSHG